MPHLVPVKVLRIIKFVYNVLDRLILLLGFIAIVTGFITYCGLFVSVSSATERRSFDYESQMTNKQYREPTMSSPALHTL